MTEKTRRRRQTKAGRTRKVKPEPVVCSPASDNSAGPYTCYSAPALTSMRNAWNSRRPDAPIKSDDPADIWRTLHTRMSTTCDTEKCWLRHKFLTSGIDRETLQYTFAPEAPRSWSKDPNEWLTSSDIEQVMSHFEHVHKSFVFLGPSPIDFDTRVEYGECVWNELCAFSLKSFLKRGKSKIGIVFNTDPHNKDGEHWISMFVDAACREPYVFFFDSTGDPPPPEVTKLADKIVKQARDLGIKMKYYENHPFEHQKGDTECGIYSLYMISQLLRGEKTHHSFKKERITDADMERMRGEFFNLPS